MKRQNWARKAVVTGLLLAAAFGAYAQQAADFSDKAETEAVERTAKQLPSLHLGTVVQSAAYGNMVGVRSEDVTFSRRLDSRTYFAQDRRYGVTRNDGVFTGSNEELERLAHAVLMKLDIPAAEMSRVMVLQEKSQVGRFERESGRIEVEKEELGSRQVRVSRSIAGVPVFSSHAVLGFSKRGEIGFMEVHWPGVPDQVLTEAHRLQYKVKNGWKPSEQKEAVVESVEAGIIHSPAISFVMDIYPVIRVIYAPTNREIGQKPVIYFDRQGQRLPAPRVFYTQPEESREHRSSTAEQK